MSPFTVRKYWSSCRRAAGPGFCSYCLTVSNGRGRRSSRLSSRVCLIMYRCDRSCFRRWSSVQVGARPGSGRGVTERTVATYGEWDDYANNAVDPRARAVGVLADEIRGRLGVLKHVPIILTEEVDTVTLATAAPMIRARGWSLNQVSIVHGSSTMKTSTGTGWMRRAGRPNGKPPSVRGSSSRKPTMRRSMLESSRRSRTLWPRSKPTGTGTTGSGMTK